MRVMDLDTTGLHFTRNWFRTRNLETFRTCIYPQFSGKPIVCLELGVFEGMSMCWMLQHVLTHPDSRAVGIDPWLMTTKLSEQDMDEVRKRAYYNVSASTGDDRTGEGLARCLLYRANSAEILRRMVGKGFAGITKNSVDLSMVDGNHNALAVWDDCRLVYQLLKPGGQMLLDDYVNDRPKKDHVKEGVDYFLAEYGSRVNLLWQHRYMICFSKV